MKKIFGLFTTLLISFVFVLGLTSKAEYEFVEDDWYPGGKTYSTYTNGLSGWKIEFANAIDTDGDGVRDAAKNYYVARGNSFNRPVGSDPSFGSYASFFTSGYGDTIPRTLIGAFGCFYLSVIDSNGTIVYTENTHPSVTPYYGEWVEGAPVVTEFPEGDRPDVAIPEGGYAILWDYLDRAGSAATDSGLADFVINQPETALGTQATVSVFEDTKPEIGGLPSVDFLLYAAGSIASFDPLSIVDPLDATKTYDVFAFDNTADNGDLTDLIEVDNPVDVNTSGDYTVTYTIPYGEEEVTKTLRVVIVDFEIFNNGDHDLLLTEAKDLGRFGVDASDVEEYFLTNISAFDAIEGDLTDRVAVDYSEVNFNEAGNYTVHYSVTNTAGDSRTYDEEITIMDNVAPVIYGAQDRKVEVNDPTFDVLENITVIDETSGSEDINVIVLEDADYEQPGEYTVEVKVMDAAGNVAETSFKVTVLPVEKYYTQDEVDALLADKENVATDFGLILSIVGIVGVALVGVFSFTKKQ